MPKRSNEFQRLVYLVRKALAQNTTVTESKMLPDTAGGEAEVDVCVEGKMDGLVVTVSIECTDRGRRPHCGWVTEMIAKHERLPTHALILASRSGFSAKALKVVAQHPGVTAIALSTVETTDFEDLLGPSGSLWSKSVTVSAAKVIVTVQDEEQGSEVRIATSPDNLLYLDGSEEGVPLSKFVEALLNLPRTRDLLLDRGEEDHTHFSLEWLKPSDHRGLPLYMQKVSYPRRSPILKIEVTGPCTFKIVQIGMTPAQLGNDLIAHGTHELFGHRATVVLAKRSNGEAGVAVDLSLPQPKS